jgi:GNAT superfamily N-acetyltransferase
MIRITQLHDLEDAKELHSMGFPNDDWTGDDHTYWVAMENGRVVGFCSAKMWEPHGVFLSRCAVRKDYAGKGLQRLMIRRRVKWAIDQGSHRVFTYVTLKNYESMINLLRCKFRFYHGNWVGPEVHYLELKLK